MFVGAGLVAGGAVMLAETTLAGARSSGHGNPAAVARPDDGVIRLAACKACNPCAAKKGCNPCAAKKGCNPCAGKKACGACNPCGAKSACGACNPCGGGAANYSSKCQVPRLVTAALCNPCAAKKGCNPCAAKGCNPCAAKKACGACNPCKVAKKGCNPCAAKGCNPCAAKKACGACNPCKAAKKGCNPCAAKGCNPCAAKKGCNPCAAKACNPCGPCGAAAAPELTTAEAKAAYKCLQKEMVGGYTKSGLKVATFYKDWDSYNTQPYVSDTHGGRFVNNFANATGRKYGKFEESGPLPVGSILAKDSFVVHGNGKMAAGPLFMMEKMPAGFNKASGNWRYSMVMPDGAVFGTTKGKGSAKVQFCIECHAAVAESQDSLMLLPDEYRVKSN